MDMTTITQAEKRMTTVTTRAMFCAKEMEYMRWATTCRKARMSWPGRAAPSSLTISSMGQPEQSAATSIKLAASGA